LTRALLDEPGLVGAGVGIEFPLHSYYRSLALKCYRDRGQPPELFPTAADVARLAQAGVPRRWGWPYFLTDECDDGYQPGTAGTAQAETRYIHQLVQTSRQLGLNGLIANAFPENIPAEMLNLYAFARFCREPSAAPADVIRDFAALIAAPRTYRTSRG